MGVMMLMCPREFDVTFAVSQQRMLLSASHWLATFTVDNSPDKWYFFTVEENNLWSPSRLLPWSSSIPNLY